MYLYVWEHTNKKCFYLLKSKSSLRPNFLDKRMKTYLENVPGEFRIRNSRRFLSELKLREKFNAVRREHKIYTNPLWLNSAIHSNRCAPYIYVIRHKKLNMLYIGSQYGKKANPSLFWRTYFTSSRLVLDQIAQHGTSCFEILEIRICKNARDLEALRLQKIYKALGKQRFLESYFNRNVSPGIVNDAHALKAISQKLRDGFKDGRIHPMLGKTHSPEVRKKMRDARNCLQFYNDGVRNYLLRTGDIKILRLGLTPGCYTSIEVRNQRRKNALGKPVSKETRQKISANSKSRTPEVRKKLSDSHKGYVMPASQRAAIGAAHRGKIRSAAARKNMKAAQALLKPLKCPHCEKSGQPRAMHRWHFTNCKEYTNASPN